MTRAPSASVKSAFAVIPTRRRGVVLYELSLMVVLVVIMERSVTLKFHPLKLPVSRRSRSEIFSVYAPKAAAFAKSVNCPSAVEQLPTALVKPTGAVA